MIMASATAKCVLYALCLAVVSGHWVNSYDEGAKLECSGNQVFSFIGSIHDNHREDRRWQFYCKEAPSKVTNCFWTGYLNAFDNQLLYNCPGNDVLNGLNSYHSNKHEDRRFQAKCCSLDKRMTVNCYFTDYINDWDGVLHFNVPEKEYVKGVYSLHDNRKEDRRWKINLCYLQ